MSVGRNQIRLMNPQPETASPTSHDVRAAVSSPRKSQPTRAAAAENEASPFLVEFFMVHAMGFLCMAYRDEAGRWRKAFDDAELAGRIRIVE